MSFGAFPGLAGWMAGEFQHAFVALDAHAAVEDKVGSLYRPDRTGVLRNQGVDGQQRNPLDSRLRH
jgi:hypothetical protein